jgi:hypothetical protein
MAAFSYLDLTISELTERLKAMTVNALQPFGCALSCRDAVEIVWTTPPGGRGAL